MKRFFQKVLRVAALALAICLAAALFPYVRDLVRSVLPTGRYDRMSQLISHEMQKAGDLTAVKYTDQAVMESTTKALLLGEVQQVRVPYRYEIGLGVHLDEVDVAARAEGVTVTVPDPCMIYDSFQVTGDPQVKDFLYPLNEGRYQEMLDGQAAACRAQYLQDEKTLAEAWEAACEALEKLIGNWTGEQIPLSFAHSPAQQAGGRKAASSHE